MLIFLMAIFSKSKLIVLMDSNPGHRSDRVVQQPLLPINLFTFNLSKQIWLHKKLKTAIQIIRLLD